MFLATWFLLIALYCPSTYCGKRNVSLDLLVIVGPTNDSTMVNSLKKALKGLPDEYTLGEDFTHVALCRPAPEFGNWNIMPFTYNATEFQWAVEMLITVTAEDRRIFNYGLLGGLFTGILLYHFRGMPDTSRARFIIILAPEPVDPQHPFFGKVLREERKVDFFVFISDSDSETRVIFQEFLDNDTRKIKITTTPEEFKQLLPYVFSNLTEPVIYNHLCRYEEDCFYSRSTGTCDMDWFTPRMPTSWYDCAAHDRSPPAVKPIGSCTKDECDFFCDRWWLTSSLCTDATCGRKTPGERLGKPLWEQLKQCPVPEFQCGRCADFPEWTIPVVAAAVVIGVAIGVAVAGHVLVKRRRVRRAMQAMEASKKEGRKKSLQAAEVGVSIRGEVSIMEKAKLPQTSMSKNAMKATGRGSSVRNATRRRSSVRNVTRGGSSVRNVTRGGSVRRK